MKLQAILIIVLALLYTIIPAGAVAQEGEVYVSIGGGVSIPLADYAKSDFDEESSGFAKPGGNFNINFGYRLNEYLSLTGLLDGCVNRLDYIKMQDQLTESMPDKSWVVESKNWGLGGLMIGATGSLPLVTNRLFIELRALGGFLYVNSPARYITGTEDGAEDIKIDTEQYSSLSWSLDFGAGLRYNRSRNQYFILYADYMLAHPYYTGVQTVSNIDFEWEDAFSQKISTINISLGIGYIVN